MEENRFPGDQIENKGNGRINLWKDEVTDHEKKKSYSTLLRYDQMPVQVQTRKTGCFT